MGKEAKVHKGGFRFLSCSGGNKIGHSCDVDK